MTDNKPLPLRVISLTLQVAGLAVIAYSALNLQNHGIAPLGGALGGALVAGLASDNAAQLSLPRSSWMLTLLAAVLCLAFLTLEVISDGSKTTVTEAVLAAITGYALGLTVRFLRAA